MKEIIPEFDFTREGRRLEHKFIKEKIKKIKELDIPKEKKEIMEYKLWNSLLKYERKYATYNKLFREYSLSSDKEVFQTRARV